MNIILAAFLFGIAVGGIVGHYWKKRTVPFCGSLVIRESAEAADGQIQFTKNLFDMAQMEEIRLRIRREPFM